MTVVTYVSFRFRMSDDTQTAGRTKTHRPSAASARTRRALEGVAAAVLARERILEVRGEARERAPRLELPHGAAAHGTSLRCDPAARAVAAVVAAEARQRYLASGLALPAPDYFSHGARNSEIWAQPRGLPSRPRTRRSATTS